MADFRKLILVLIAGCLLLTTVASAAPYKCLASSVRPQVRAEGFAEYMGDISMDCGGVVPAGGITVDVHVTLVNTQITSNLLDEGSSTPTVSEALLILDGGASGFIGYSAISGSTLTPYTNGTQNIYQAQRVSDNEIVWRGVTLAAVGSTGSTTHIRITNVRGNAFGVGVNGSIGAYVNMDPFDALNVDNANNLVVADTRAGMAFSVQDWDGKDKASAFKSCVSTTKASDGGQIGFKLKFAELLAGAFLTEEEESGFTPSLSSGDLVDPDNIGVANQPTRLVGRIKGVPSGVSLAVPLTVASSPAGLTLTYITGTNSTFAGGDVADEGDFGHSLGDVDLDSSGNGVVVYEVSEFTNANSPHAIESVVIPVYFAYSKPGTPGAVTASGNFAPICTGSTCDDQSASLPEPRFADGATDKAALSISLCRTILLFPYVTDQAGFDTGIAISNTSSDPLGTTGQAGACKLSFFGNTSGSTGPVAQTTPSIPAGGQLVMLLSAGGSVVAQNGGVTACGSGACVAPGFQGYIFAVCDFQYAHGFAFVSDLGAQKLAQGYLALVVPDRSDGVRQPDPMSTAGSLTGEQLTN